jgi:hypothetical protein
MTNDWYWTVILDSGIVHYTRFHETQHVTKHLVWASYGEAPLDAFRQLIEDAGHDMGCVTIVVCQDSFRDADTLKLFGWLEAQAEAKDFIFASTLGPVTRKKAVASMEIGVPQ